MAGCRWALIVLLLGVVLLLLPEGGGEGAQPAAGGTEAFDLEAFESKLAGVLSGISGAGKVELVLTLDSGSRRVLARDTGQDGDSATTVTVGVGAGAQEVVELQTISPGFRGALVVCPGGEDPAVRLALTRAVSALTGLGANDICICRGERQKS